MKARPMFFVEAEVVKLKSDDGLVALKSDVHLGDRFVVDLYAQKDVAVLPEDGDMPLLVRVIQCVEDGGYLLKECLKLKTAPTWPQRGSDGTAEQVRERDAAGVHDGADGAGDDGAAAAVDGPAYAAAGHGGGH